MDGVDTAGELTIGGLARHVGVNVETVRYYERRRLLEPPRRTAGGYRTYGPTDIARLQFVRRAKDLGFTLREIASFSGTTVPARLTMLPPSLSRSFANLTMPCGR